MKYCFFFSPTIQGEHTDKIYTYRVGICTSPDKNFNDMCGILQYDKFPNGTADPSRTRCIGKITNTQVAESMITHTCVHELYVSCTGAWEFSDVWIVDCIV